MTRAKIEKMSLHELDMAITEEFGVGAAPLDLNQCRKLESEVFNRAVMREYIRALSEQVDAEGLTINLTCWRLLHADATQRSRAALLAIHAKDLWTTPAPAVGRGAK